MKTLLRILILAILVSPALAANYWTGEGADNLWTNPDNWSGTYPDTRDQHKLQGDGEVIEVLPGDDIVVNRAILIDGTSVSGGLDDTTTTLKMTGGSVTCATYFRVGYFSTFGSGPYEGAVIDLSGDAYFQAGTLEICQRNYSLTNIHITENAKLYVTGSSTGFKYPGYDNATGTIARVWISGNGVLEANSFAMNADEDGQLDISGDGVLKVGGDVQASVLDPLIALGAITTDNGSTVPHLTYDGTWTWVMSPNNSLLAKPNTPSPADRSTTNTIVDLSWNPGNANNTWDLYLGTDPEGLSLVESGLVSPEYKLSCLDFDTTYYWRVDEFAGTVTVEGDLWSFSARGYARLFWFEYADQNALEAEWVANNSLIGVSNDPARGDASMALVYDNTASPYLSEATSLTLPFDGDIACTNGVAMSVWIYGDEGNSDESVYASFSDGTNTATAVMPASGATQTANWTVWDIDMRDFIDNNPAIDMGNLTSLTLGVGDPSSPAAGGTGTVYFDNVNLFPVRCLNRPVADLNGDCAVDMVDFAIVATEWLADGNFPVF